MQIEKLKRLAVAVIDCEDVSGGISASMDFMAEISPVAVLELISEIERLRMERERVLADAAVGAAIQRAAKELPLGYIIGISVEADAASVDLCAPTGHIKTMDVDDDNRLAAEINAAISAARDLK